MCACVRAATLCLASSTLMISPYLSTHPKRLERLTPANGNCQACRACMHACMCVCKCMRRLLRVPPALALKCGGGSEQLGIRLVS